MSFASAYARILASVRPTLAASWSDEVYERTQSIKKTVLHESGCGPIQMAFFTPNAVCRYRAETFSDKEPETLEWIERFGGTGAFFDVGANIGLYSVYYAMAHPGAVYAFEPSVLNLALLAKNISANGLSDRIVIVSSPLTSVNQIAPFHLSSLHEGGALSTFGADYGHDGQPLAVQMSFATLGFSLDFLIESGVISDLPALLKIDVDGIEHFILQGSINTLSSPALKSILIEVNEDFGVLARSVEETLTDAGFYLFERRHSEMTETGQFSHTFNQIWVRE